MGRQGKWFLAFKRLLASELNDKKKLKSEKSKEIREFSEAKDHDPIPPDIVEASGCDAAPQLLLPPTQEPNVAEKEDELSKHAYPVALVSVVATEAAAIADQAPAAVIHLAGNSTTVVPSKLREEIAAINIQTAFRGYMAKRTFRDLRRLSRLKEIVDGDAVKRQTMVTMHAMQALSRVQSQIRSRKIRISEENQSLQSQLQLKEERELEKLKSAGEWNYSRHSKEQIQAKQVNKQEAAMRRERALAYAFSHQWKSSSKALTPVFSDANSPQWDWSWVERWTATRPWESRSAGETSDQAPTKSLNHIMIQETVKANVHHERTLAVQRSRPVSRHSPSVPPSKPPPSVTENKKSVSPWGVYGTKDDDSGSIVSERARMRRHSIGGFSEVSLGSSSAIPSYVSSPVSAAKGKFQLHSPSKGSATNPEKGTVGLLKKRLSFPAAADKCTVSSPTNLRRYSVPPKVDMATVVNDTANGEQTTSNGGSK